MNCCEKCFGGAMGNTWCNDIDCPCHQKPTPPTQWEEEFDEKFASTEHPDEIAGAVSRYTIKEFITSLLEKDRTTRRELLIEKLEGMKKKDFGGFSGTSLTLEELARNKALTDIIQVVREV